MSHSPIPEHLFRYFLKGELLASNSTSMTTFLVEQVCCWREKCARLRREQSERPHMYTVPCSLPDTEPLQGAVAAMTKAMALDHAREGIRVNAVRSGR